MRPDTFAYLTARLGSAIAADDWLRRLGTSKAERVTTISTRYPTDVLELPSP